MNNFKSIFFASLHISCAEGRECACMLSWYQTESGWDVSLTLSITYAAQWQVPWYYWLLWLNKFMVTVVSHLSGFFLFLFYCFVGLNQDGFKLPSVASHVSVGGCMVSHKFQLKTEDAHHNMIEHWGEVPTTELLLMLNLWCKNIIRRESFNFSWSLVVWLRWCNLSKWLQNFTLSNSSMNKPVMIQCTHMHMKSSVLQLKLKKKIIIFSLFYY